MGRKKKNDVQKPYWCDEDPTRLAPARYAVSPTRRLAVGVGGFERRS
jgi:hypothetical protein